MNNRDYIYKKIYFNDVAYDPIYYLTRKNISTDIDNVLFDNFYVNINTVIGIDFYNEIHLASKEKIDFYE